MLVFAVPCSLDDAAFVLDCNPERFLRDSSHLKAQDLDGNTQSPMPSGSRESHP